MIHHYHHKFSNIQISNFQYSNHIFSSTVSLFFFFFNLSAALNRAQIFYVFHSFLPVNNNFDAENKLGNVRVGAFSVLKIFTSYPSFFITFPFLINTLSAFFLLNFTKLSQYLRYSWHSFNFISSSMFSQYHELN